MIKALARWRYRLTRLNGYLVALTFPATILTWFKVYDISLWWSLLIIPLVVIVLFFDDKVGAKEENNFLMNRNSQMQEILDFVRRKNP